MFKINHCKIFGHKLYTTMTLKKKHDGTKKRENNYYCYNKV